MREKPKIQPQPGDKVLWIRFSAFGDVLQAAAAAQRFKMKYPEVRLTFLTQPEYADILEAQPYIDDQLHWDVKKRPQDFFKIARQIRAFNFGWLFSMHRSSAAALVALFSGVYRRFGYNRQLQFCYRTTHWEFFNSMGVEIASRDSAAIFTTPENREKAETMLSGLPEKKIFAVIGASKPQKFWPVRHWKIFLKEAMQHGWGVVLNGHGDFEARAAKEIEEELRCPSLLNLVGQLPFPLMAAVAQASTVAVGNDTGPLHLAGLLGIPTLGFFGVTNAHGAGYRMPWFRDVRVACPNEGCWDYRCPVDCLADISPERAFRDFRDFFERGYTLWNQETEM
ncbi:MAG: glycosyltransferase family 9 protein [Synergistaceae bacterium]|nr:glycosyltransferase family 9 protein [Synergistaceae bacterium]